MQMVQGPSPNAKKVRRSRRATMIAAVVGLLVFGMALPSVGVRDGIDDGIESGL